MASSDMTVTKRFATIECDATQRTVTIPAPPTGSTLPAGIPGWQLVLTNLGSVTARIGIIGSTLGAPGAGTNADGECDVLAGEAIVLDRGCPGFVHKANATTILRVTSGAG